MLAMQPSLISSRYEGESVSTHTANLGLLFKVIPPETRPKVIVLGIQPGNMEFGQGLSEPVRATMENLAEMLISSINWSTHA